MTIPSRKLNHFSLLAGVGSLALLCGLYALQTWKLLGAGIFSEILAYVLYGVFAGALVLYLINLVRVRKTKKMFFPLFALHLGLLIGMAGFCLNQTLGQKGFVFITEGKSSDTLVLDSGKKDKLPFEIKLADFKVLAYPESLRVKEYRGSLTLQGNGVSKDAEISVNSPVDFEGFQIFQQDYGLEQNPDGFIKLQISKNGEMESHEIKLGEPFPLAEGGWAEIADFSPTVGFKEGRPVTVNSDALLNPAYLVRYSLEGEYPSMKLMLPRYPDTLSLEGYEFKFEDYFGIEYTVLSLVRHPFDDVIYAAMALITLSAFGFFWNRRRLA